MRKLYEIDLRKLRELTEEYDKQSPTLDELSNLDKEYKPFEYSDLRISTEGILYYPTHTSDRRVSFGGYLYDREDMICVLDTTKTKSESLVIADFSKLNKFNTAERKFHFNRVLNMYRSGREPIIELSLFLEGSVEQYADRQGYYQKVDGRDVNIWILQLQQFCRDIEFLYGEGGMVPLLEILGSILNKDSSSPVRMKHEENPEFRKDKKGPRYKLYNFEFPDVTKEIHRFYNETLRELSLSKIQGDKTFENIVAVVQALCKRPDLIKECVQCKEAPSYTLRFHKNNRLSPEVHKRVHHEIRQLMAPLALDLMMGSQDRMKEFVVSHNLETAVYDFTELHDISWGNPVEIRPVSIDDAYRTGEGKLVYPTAKDPTLSSYHVPLDTILGSYGKQVDLKESYTQLLQEYNPCLREDLSKIITMIDEDNMDLNLTMPMARYLPCPGITVQEILPAAEVYDIRKSKLVKHKLSTESVKSFFRSIERMWS